MKLLIIILLFGFAAVSCSQQNAATPPPPGELPANASASERALYFATSDDSDFEKMGTPKKGEWLDRFPEYGQPYEYYIQFNPVTRTDKRNKIILQPIGPFTDREKDLLAKLREFTEIFFDCPTVLAEAINLPEDHYRMFTSGSKSWRQYLTGYFLEDVLPKKLTDDAICCLGITMADLYPGESWNYVFGEASLRDRVGIYSLVRYFPAFWDNKETPDSLIQALRRSCKTLSHETGHIFSMEHCIYYNCGMNGSNSLEESDRQPLMFCPVCLKKLQWNLKFDVVKRYEKMKKFFGKNEMKEESERLEKRIKKINDFAEKERTTK